MSRRPWYKRYGGDFVLGTMSLTLEEKGAYSLCLDLIYDRGGPIPDDARWLAGVCGVSLRKWGSLRDALISAGKLVSANGLLSNRRADHELADADASSRELSENGAKGGRKRAENASKTICKVVENEGVSNENNTLDQAGLKPNQKPDTREEEPPNPQGGEGRSRKSKRQLADGPAAFEALWLAYPHHPGRSSKNKSLAIWRDIDAETQAALPAGAARFGREGRPTTGAKAMERWLVDQNYRDWLAMGQSQTQPARQFPEATIRAAALARLGESFVLGRLDLCDWDADRSAIIAPNKFITDQIAREGQALKALGVLSVKTAQSEPA